MSHTRFAECIPDLVRGTAPEPDRRAFVTHAAGCERCTTLLEEHRRLYRDLLASNEDAARDHPEPSALRAHALGHGDDADVDRHLIGCAACALVADGWKELPGTIEPTATGSARRRRLGWGVGVAAAVALTWAIAPSLAPFRPDTAAPTLETLPLHYLDVPDRSGDAPAPRLATDGGRAMVGVEARPERCDDTVYELRLWRGEAPLPWRVERRGRELCAQLDPSGVLLVPMPVSELEPGSYRLRMRSLASPFELEFVFELAASPPAEEAP